MITHASRGEGPLGENGPETKRASRVIGTPAKHFCEVELEGLDVRGLEALRSLGYFEFNSLAIVQRLIAISLNRGEMDENVLAALALDEAEALAGIEPLHCSLFFTHCVTLFCQPNLRLSITKLSYLVPREPLLGEFVRRRVKKNGRKFEPCDRFQNPKAIQEQQTQ